MEKSFVIYDDILVTWDETPEVIKKVYDAVIEFCKKHNATAGEVIMQDDDCQIYSSGLISSIVDNIIKFKTKEI